MTACYHMTLTESIRSSLTVEELNKKLRFGIYMFLDAYKVEDRDFNVSRCKDDWPDVYRITLHIMDTTTRRFTLVRNVFTCLCKEYDMGDAT